MFIEIVIAVLIAAVLSVCLAHVLEGRAPARRDTRARSIAGFFPPLLLVCWSFGLLITPSGPHHWARIWLVVGLAGLGLAWLLAIAAPPTRPTKRELRRAERRGSPVDHAFLLYSFGMGIALLAAVVTRDLWVS